MLSFVADSSLAGSSLLAWTLSERWDLNLAKLHPDIYTSGPAICTISKSSQIRSSSSKPSSYLPIGWKWKTKEGRGIGLSQPSPVPGHRPPWNDHQFSGKRRADQNTPKALVVLFHERNTHRCRVKMLNMLRVGEYDIEALTLDDFSDASPHENHSGLPAKIAHWPSSRLRQLCVYMLSAQYSTTVICRANFITVWLFTCHSSGGHGF